LKTSVKYTASAKQAPSPTNQINGSMLYQDESYKIIGAAMKVHRELGCGFLEQVYQEALQIELQKQNIPFEREALLSITYDGVILKKQYVADFKCYDKIIVELKAVKELDNIDEAQVFNYLKATGYKLGLLINFGEPSLAYKRIVKEK
jgi:GxxExxY protein